MDISAPGSLGRQVRVGDSQIQEGTTTTLVYVTAVAGQTITFDQGHPLGLNQFDTLLPC